MFFYMSKVWPASQDTARRVRAPSIGRLSSRMQGPARALPDKLAPDFMVTATRSALLAMTTSLTRVSDRVHGVCQRLNQALAFDRMMRAMFPWAAPRDPFDLSAFWLAAFSVPAAQRQPPSTPLTDFWPVPRTQQASDPFLAAAFSAPMFGLIAAMAPACGLGFGGAPFWGAFYPW
jgi:hypothetical protein